MKKLIALMFAVTLMFGGVAQAGILNAEEGLFPSIKDLVDNATETENYSAGVFLSHDLETGCEYYAVNIYDFTYLADKFGTVPLSGLQLGYAGSNKVVLGYAIHADEVLREACKRTPGLVKIGEKIPEKLVFNVGYAVAADSQAWDQVDRYDYGPIFTGTIDF